MAGKPKSSQIVERPIINCGYSSCLANAVASVWTATGWLNVCRDHHRTAQIVPRRTENLLCEEIRARHAKSYAFGKRLGPVVPVREPGEDREELALGIERDLLETEFMDRAQP